MRLGMKALCWVWQICRCASPTLLRRSGICGRRQTPIRNQCQRGSVWHGCISRPGGSEMPIAGFTKRVALAPGSPDLLLLEAEIDLRGGNRDAAARAAGDLQAILVRQLDNQPLLLAVGSLQARVGQSALARGNLERVLKLTDGKSVAALRFLARLDLQNNDLSAADERLQQLRSLNDQGPEFELLQGDVRLASGDR